MILLPILLQLNQAAEVVTINNNTFELDAYVYVNYMPIIVPYGQINHNNRVTSINWLIEYNGHTIPNNIRLETQYLIKGNTAYEMPYNEKYLPMTNTIIQKTSRHRLPLTHNIWVHVVAVILDVNTDKRYYIKKECVWITDVY